MFYAVGVGPGDPMWMTREACAVLEACPVIAAPQTASGEMLALSIAQGAAELGGKTVLPLSFAMSRDAAVRAAGYAHAADAIAPELDAGRDVAMVNLGDVSIYATAYYVLDELRRRGYDTRMVPGVASFSAVAAALGRSLTEMELPLHIYPAGASDLDAALAQPGTQGADEVRQSHRRDRRGALAARSGGGFRHGRRLRPAHAAGVRDDDRACRRRSAILPR